MELQDYEVIYNEDIKFQEVKLIHMQDEGIQGKGRIRCGNQAGYENVVLVEKSEKNKRTHHSRILTIITDLYIVKNQSILKKLDIILAAPIDMQYQRRIILLVFKEYVKVFKLDDLLQLEVTSMLSKKSGLIANRDVK